MTATTDFIGSKVETRRMAQEVGFASLQRWTYRFIGFALLLAAVGLWVAPGASFAADVILMKFGVTFFFGLVGLTFVMSASER